MKICTIDNCNKKYYAKGWCKIHWQRWYRHGDPHTVKLNHRKHGMWQSPEYSSWSGMKDRCSNPNNPRYKHYGGRGIKVYDEWKESFSAFYSYIGTKPTAEHSLDRIDVDGNYEPGNVRWATPQEQSYNKRLQYNNISGYRGVSYDSITKRWRADIKQDISRIRIGRYDTTEQAALAYDCAAIQIYGYDAKLNILKQMVNV